MATLEPARERLRRIRARVLRAELSRLDEADRELAARLGAAERSLDERIDMVSERAARATWWSGPRVWNDLGRGSSPPLPAPAQLLVPGALVAALEAQHPSAQRDLLAEIPHAELEREAREDRWPLPAPEDREGYFADDHLAYWLSGLGDYLLIAKLAGELGESVARAPAFCDLGCSTGRVLRHVARREPRTSVYGIDIQQQAVAWVRDHLGPGVCVALGSTPPALPLADGEIDVVFGGSVFTHIDAFEEGWLLEVRRVLRPGGVALLTFHSERIWEEMRDNPNHDLLGFLTATPTRIESLGIEVADGVFDRPIPGPRVVFTATEYPINNANLIHSHEWVRERWGRVLPLEQIVERAYGEVQDMAVLRKPDS